LYVFCLFALGSSNFFVLHFFLAPLSSLSTRAQIAMFVWKL
jgi:hypothetical protein